MLTTDASNIHAAPPRQYHIFRVGDVNCSCSKIDIENMVGEEHKYLRRHKCCGL